MHEVKKNFIQREDQTHFNNISYVLLILQEEMLLDLLRIPKKILKTTLTKLEPQKFLVKEKISKENSKIPTHDVSTS